MTTKTAVREFIQTKLMAEKDQNLSDTDSLIETGIIDSLGILKLINYLETTFSIKMNDDDLVAENFETIQAISSYIAKCSDGKRAAATGSLQ